MEINTSNFFKHYIIHPLAPELSFKSKVAALVGSIVLFPLTLHTLWKQHKTVQVLSPNNVISPNQDRKDIYNRLSSTIEKVSFSRLQPQLHTQHVRIKQQDVPGVINQRFIKGHYSQKLPGENEVTVPVTDPATGEKIWRRWNDLSREEKIRVNNTGTRPHNQLPPHATEDEVNSRFFTSHGQAPFIDGDPRGSHGNDHCSRAAIFAGVFAYLYQKYHPVHEVSMQDITLSQITAAGHDSGRQTEGPDVYDDTSAETTVNYIKKMGVNDPAILQDVHEAIADKDSHPDANKCLIAKCVQNADCAEFARLLLRSPRQDQAGFESSRNYLDIYSELKEMAKEINPENPSAAVLKGGLTFQEFCMELDGLRVEMNDFIFHTHGRDFRENAVKSNNYYGAVLDYINPTEFPLLNTIVVKTGIKPPVASIETLQKKHDVSMGKAWLQYGLHKIPSDSLKTMANTMSKHRAWSLVLSMNLELSRRDKAERAFTSELGKVPLEPSSLIHAYAQLPLILKNQYREDFFQKVMTLNANPLMYVERMVDSIEDLDRQRQDRVVVLDLMQQELKEIKNEIEKATFSSTAQARILKTNAQSLLRCYLECDETLRDHEAQTTAAVALQKAAAIYVEFRRPEQAMEALEIASREIVLDQTNPFYDLKALFKGKAKDAFMYLPSDCGFLRHRKMRICQKEIKITDQGETKPYYELSFELPSQERTRLNKMLALIPEDQKSVVPAKYYQKKQGVYDPNHTQEVGTDLKINLDPDVEVLLGNSEYYWNQYHMMRIRIPADASPQKIQEVLSKVGLPMALMPSRQEDIRKEILARSIAFRFPDIYYADTSNKKSPEVIYEQLKSDQKFIIDEDVKKAKVTVVGKDHYEVVLPHIADEAWANGVRAVGTFIKGGDSMAQTAEVMKLILNGSLMSSEERFQNGIIGLGCAPTYNFATGSGNQVFGRILTKNLFTENFNMERFPIRGQIFVMMRPQVLERMPYTYLTDRGGIRNPNYSQRDHRPEGGLVTKHFVGQNIIPERRGFVDTVKKLGTMPHPLNETMFNLNVGAKYIQSLIVSSEEDRYNLLAALQKVQIYQIGGVPIEKAVVVARELRPELIDRFDQTENPYQKGGEHDIDYI